MSLRKLLLLLVALGLLAFLSSACIAVHRPNRRVVRTWQRPNGCWVKRVVYPCYYKHGNLKVQWVKCPGRRRWKERQWVHRDNRCRARRRTYRDMP